MATVGLLPCRGLERSLESFVNSVTKDIDDPETKMPVLSVKSWSPSRVRLQMGARNFATGRDIRMEALGSGSDYTAFRFHDLGNRQHQPGLTR